MVSEPGQPPGAVGADAAAVSPGAAPSGVPGRGQPARRPVLRGVGSERTQLHGAV